MHVKPLNTNYENTNILTKQIILHFQQKGYPFVVNWLSYKLPTTPATLFEKHFKKYKRTEMYS